MAVCTISEQPIAWDTETGRWTEEVSRYTHDGPCVIGAMARVFTATDGQPCHLPLCAHGPAQWRAGNVHACDVHLPGAVRRAMLAAALDHIDKVQQP